MQNLLLLPVYLPAVAGSKSYLVAEAASMRNSCKVFPQLQSSWESNLHQRKCKIDILPLRHNAVQRRLCLMLNLLTATKVTHSSSTYKQATYSFAVSSSSVPFLHRTMINFLTMQPITRSCYNLPVLNTVRIFRLTFGLKFATSSLRNTF